MKHQELGRKPERYINEGKITDPEERRKVEFVLSEINALNKRHFWWKKRLAGIIVSLGALLVLALPLGLILLVVFLSDGHNPIFKQKRIGRFGKPFYMYKVRTMVPDAEKMLGNVMAKNEMDGPVFKIKEDPRITRFGKFLRKTSLDELPQLFNVLRGDMVMIGPRPPLPREVEQYSEYHKIRLLITPGITCLWQVQPQRNTIPFERWVDLDIEYIKTRSVRNDLKILFLTVKVMFAKEGC